MVTRCCQVVTSCDQEVFLAVQKWQEKCFGVMGVAKKVFWCGGSGKKVFWRGGSDDSAPFSSDKIRAKILDLGYGGARRALYNLSPKSARILSAAITIDRWTGA